MGTNSVTEGLEPELLGREDHQFEILCHIHVIISILKIRYKYQKIDERWFGLNVL